jgi:hypothetical protein
MFHPIPACLCIFSALQPERRNSAVIGQDGALHFFVKANAPDDTVTAFVVAIAARTFTYREAFN